MKKFLLFLVIGIVVILFLLLGVLLPVYFIYQNGKGFIAEIQEQTKQRAYEIAIALDTMSGESFYYDNFISLSNVMAKVIEYSNQRDDPFRIKEIFLLDNQGNLIAHNNIVKVAKSFQPKYEKETFRWDEVRFQGNPVELKITGFAKLELPEEFALYEKILFFVPVRKIVENSLKKHLPELLANEYHIITSVYPPDEVLPKATLHILIQNQGIQKVTSYWFGELLKNFMIFLGIFVIVLLSMITFFILKMVPKPTDDDTKQNQAKKEPTYEEEELPLEPIKVEDIDTDKDLEKEKKEVSMSSKVIPFEEAQKLKIEKEKKEEKFPTINENIMDAVPLE
ncbi:MAG: hypothetical protein NZ853_04365 [Leptospiraceae bacterium]|nr:hypothetical protein [Leptospiraceae bacterium]MDW7975408.1 hypothetical protein [Leptospiraceae bacterium]